MGFGLGLSRCLVLVVITKRVPFRRSTRRASK